jgi:hypothetical protein
VKITHRHSMSSRQCVPGISQAGNVNLNDSRDLRCGNAWDKQHFKTAEIGFEAASGSHFEFVM